MVQLVLSPALFACASVHQPKTGVVHKYIKELLKQAHLQARLGFYLTMHLCANLQAFPQYAIYYVNELADLCMFHEEHLDFIDVKLDKFSANVVAHITHSFSEDYSRQAEKQKAQNKDKDKDTVLYSESMIRVCVWTLLEAWTQELAASVHGKEKEKKMDQAQKAVSRFLGELVLRLLQLNAGFVLESTASDNSPAFIRRAYLWQTMCVLSRSIPYVADNKQFVAQLRPKAWAAFEQTNSPSIRHLTEVFMSHFMALYPQFIVTDVLPRMSHNASRPTLLSSLVLVAGYGVLLNPMEKREKLRDGVLVAMVPLLSSNFGHVRVLAQYFFHTVACESTPSLAGHREAQMALVASEKQAKQPSPTSPAVKEAEDALRQHQRALKQSAKQAKKLMRKLKNDDDEEEEQPVQEEVKTVVSKKEEKDKQADVVLKPFGDSHTTLNQIFHFIDADR